MGCFYSHCKKCAKHITWFLEVPKDYTCTFCGTYNSPEEIEDSFFGKSYLDDAGRQNLFKEYVLEAIDQGKTRDEVLYTFGRDFIKFYDDVVAEKDL